MVVCCWVTHHPTASGTSGSWLCSIVCTWLGRWLVLLVATCVAAFGWWVSWVARWCWVTEAGLLCPVNLGPLHGASSCPGASQEPQSYKLWGLGPRLAPHWVPGSTDGWAKAKAELSPGSAEGAAQGMAGWGYDAANPRSWGVSSPECGGTSCFKNPAAPPNCCPPPFYSYPQCGFCSSQGPPSSAWGYLSRAQWPHTPKSHVCFWLCVLAGPPPSAWSTSFLRLPGYLCSDLSHLFVPPLLDLYFGGQGFWPRATASVIHVPFIILCIA